MYIYKYYLTFNLYLKCSFLINRSNIFFKMIVEVDQTQKIKVLFYSLSYISLSFPLSRMCN